MSRVSAALWDLLLGRSQSEPALVMAPRHGLSRLQGEGLEGLVYSRLQRAGLPLLPCADALRPAYRQTAAANMVMLLELRAVLDALGDLRDELLILPGAALLPLYPDLGCRPMDDIDLLAARGHLPELRRRLRAAGLDSPRRHDDVFRGAALTLDLHGDALNSDRIRSRRLAGAMDYPALWECCQPAQLDAAEVRTLAPEDALIYSAAHAVRHGYSRLTWLIDMALLIQGGVDWAVVRGRAARFGLERQMLYALRLLAGEAGVVLSPAGNAWRHAMPLGPLERVLIGRAYADGPAGEWGDLLWACCVPRLGRRLWFLLGTAFPRPAVLLQVFPRLPRRLVALAYLLRVLQLGVRAIRLGATYFRRPTR
jgi:hypothetical protein